ncbi:exopolysaccharide biosynthesis protein [Shewanella sp. GD03713]|uniref:exopolysaccharide biosynthesis protein n=1 Tax=Shewanella sp. GD03713 TaxID=2975372 RepID=UPI001593332B|nr:exopolysaccharide biosynthesis protein [Shewanella sp. GD03713]MDH1470347.1 exopolysaccharide biosynthesis protein [Shewanella sp. GD03713]QXN26971.1 exopolysaccharide biosynthesis protein [Shewanella putrefaciens]
MKASQEGYPLLWLKRALVNGSSLPAPARRKLYLKTVLSALAVIWLITGLVIVITPTRYTCKWVLILPGAGAGAVVSLDSLGQASSSSSSPYLSSAIDPRENYKAIALSDKLLSDAAAQLDLKASALGTPKLKLPSQTGLMEFSISANSAELAEQKAWAHYRTLQGTLSHLRIDEIHIRENGVRMGLESFADKVHQSQANIVAFQSETGLVSLDQFKEVAVTIEHLRQSQVNLTAKLNGGLASQQLLEADLSLTATQSTDLLKLKNDQLFQQLLLKYTESTALLVGLNGHYGEQHPQVLSAKTEQKTMLDALHSRCQKLLARCDPKLMLILSVDDIDGRAALMQKLINITTENEGLAHELTSLSTQIDEWETRLKHSNDDAAKLEDLHRDHQLATAVFTSAIAKIDVGKADIFSAYPLLQLFAAPTRPEKPDKLGLILTLVGGIAASMMVIVGLSILWIRKPILQKILTND